MSWIDPRDHIRVTEEMLGCQSAPPGSYGGICMSFFMVDIYLPDPSSMAKPDVVIVWECLNLHTEANQYFPTRWCNGKESPCQCKRLRFDPWVGKIPWRRQWQPTPVFLPGKSHRQRSLVGYSLRGCKGLGMTYRLCIPSPPNAGNSHLTPVETVITQTADTLIHNLKFDSNDSHRCPYQWEDSDSSRAQQKGQYIITPVPWRSKNPSTA